MTEELSAIELAGGLGRLLVPLNNGFAYSASATRAWSSEISCSLSRAAASSSLTLLSAMGSSALRATADDGLIVPWRPLCARLEGAPADLALLGRAALDGNPPAACLTESSSSCSC